MKRSALVLATLLVGCGSEESSPRDSGPEADSDMDTDTDSDADLPVWDRGLPSTERLDEVRGRSVVRGIIHCHSVYSHDACDGDNFVDGVPNEQCLSRLRWALCETRQDFAMMTEHDSEMADHPFEEMFLVREDDEAVMEGDVQIASRIECPEGGRTLLFAGAENDIMPVMLTRHPDGNVDARRAAYGTRDPVVAEQFRDQGGILLVNHSESWSVEELGTFSPDGIEIYNLHAVLDPDSRRADLGLDALGAMAAAASFALDDREPLADLVFLAIHGETTAWVDRWDALLEDGPMVGVLGTDSHENSIPGELSDGERGDSYRRMFRWMGNYLLVSSEDPAGIREALSSGRLYGAVHLLGVPLGFDFSVETKGGVLEMGESGTWEAGTTAHLRMPTVLDLDPSLPVPSMRAVILEVARGSRETIAEGDSDLDVQLEGPGVYRAEVHIEPRHLAPYLNGYGPELIREMPWVYSGAIRIE